MLLCAPAPGNASPEPFHTRAASHETSGGDVSDDIALVRRIRDDDTAALATLMERYVASLTRFAYGIVRSRDLADDVVQSVFIHVWERRALLDPSRPVKSYLYRAVQNHAFNVRKADRVRDRYRTFVSDAARAGTVPSSVPSPESEILTTADVRAAIEQLPERRQIALQLRLEGLTHVEIGDVLGLSPMAAQSLVSRALADLRAALKSG